MARTRRGVAYSGIAKRDLILRDQLALDRTALANERTLLAYIRSTIALLAAGITLIHFFDIASATILGYAMLPFAPAMLGWGLWRFFQVRRHLRLEVEASPARPGER